MLKDVADQVKGGAVFSAALARHPECFDGLYVNLIKAGEASGTLGSTLERMCQHLRKESEIQKQVRGAMIYPCVLLGCCVLVVASVLTFVLPKFEQIYSGKSAVLPAPTRVLLGLSGFMLRNWALLLVAVTAAVTAMRIGAGSLAANCCSTGSACTSPIIGPMSARCTFPARSAPWRPCSPAGSACWSPWRSPPPWWAMASTAACGRAWPNA